ncbi:S-adenosylmethionine:tRNA ribosyltransferase-isomerase [Pontibacillus salicampi]|uniref:S-adenosylmethionine:tRNA ribosyltransferase-isomerase n=1 Tax=Pontibacillus salicampi TaxID=1449801 RepID=A0ABV6LLX9_9BACI
MSTAHQSFQIPDSLNASLPAEYRGKQRDDVKMMVTKPDRDSYHSHFRNLTQWLEEGDLLVLNNSRTIPPVLYGKQYKQKVEIRLSRMVSPLEWDALIIGNAVQVNSPIKLPNGVEIKVLGQGAEAPLMRVAFSLPEGEFIDFVLQHGSPVQYEYMEENWPLDMFQTVFASVPGSVEMPSAGRAFSWRLLRSLKAQGINTAFITLHTGLSYYENNHWPTPKGHPEIFEVPATTAEVIQETKAKGRKVVAVGTTVVRALETAALPNGGIQKASGVTDLHIDGNTPLYVTDGLLTGFHEPEASHLDMLSAFIPQERLLQTYQEAIKKGYLWHEFGDVNLLFKRNSEE